MMIKVKPSAGYPQGDWRPLDKGFSFDVAGLHYRRSESESFVHGGSVCERRGWPWGVTCEREPNNSHDGNAVAVFGWWTAKRWFSRRQERVQIGYWPRELAQEVAKFIPPEVPLGARVANLYLSDGGFIDIEIVALVDRSWSGKKLDWQ